MPKCTKCGKTIKHPHCISGKAYGYNCYKQELALLYKEFEDEKNKEYSVKCFAAMQVFERKKNSNFHDSICKQWNECRKLTAKQLECIIKGFAAKESIQFWLIWASLTQDEMLKWSIPMWVENKIAQENISCESYIDNELFISCMLKDKRYKKNGFHFSRLIEDGRVYITENGKNDYILIEDEEDEDCQILKVVKTS